ncbi:MAG: tRNA dihydrouridine synthase DusB [Oligoflexia bacterium]|nr:tRNA dihydrouridine synthase DusB [Oligoflexia bacterium]
MSIRLGPFTLDHPFILAPMAGITNSPFRRLMRRMKSSMVVSELVSANGIEYGGQKTLDLLRFHEEERVVGLQVFGERTENLVKACQVVERLGADFVDLNLGCPVPKVVSKGAGSAMCRNPSELGRVLAEMVKSVKIPVTIKIRTGWDANSRNALDVVNAAADAGVTWVAIHGRTRAQGYSGLADWEFIARVKEKSPIPIIGNGDIHTPEVAVEKMRHYGVDAVLIGRGALRNPFIFEQAAALWAGESYLLPEASRYIALIDEQKKMLHECYPARSAMIHARKFLAWYSSGFPGCHEFRGKVFATPDPDVLWEEARLFFEKSAKERDLRFMAQPFLMGGHG